MIPWLAAIKDAVIVAAILALGWWVYHSGENAVHVRDIKSLQTQMTRMQDTEQRWQRQEQAANAVKQTDLTAINSGAVVRPLHVELCPAQPTVETVLPTAASGAAGKHSEAGRGHVPPQPDIGPALQSYERWLERNFADCRAVIATWPKP